MKRIDRRLLQELSERARQSPRLRAHHNLHETLEAPVQRLLIALQPGTYVTPHRHPEANKWEMMLILAGRVAVLCFDDAGQVSARHELAPEGPEHALELPPGTWHSLVALEPDSVMLEVKEGPYRPNLGQGFAEWAPREGEPAAADFERWARQAAPGERPHTGLGRQAAEH